MLRLTHAQYLLAIYTYSFIEGMTIFHTFKHVVPTLGSSVNSLAMRVLEEHCRKDESQGNLHPSLQSETSTVFLSRYRALKHACTLNRNAGFLYTPRMLRLIYWNSCTLMNTTTHQLYMRLANLISTESSAEKLGFIYTVATSFSVDNV